MMEPNTELVLRDISRRLKVLMEEVANGEPVDTDLLQELNQVSEQVFLKHTAGLVITKQELDLMTDLVSLLELRTTLIYKNPPES